MFVIFIYNNNILHRASQNKIQTLCLCSSTELNELRTRLLFFFGPPLLSVYNWAEYTAHQDCVCVYCICYVCVCVCSQRQKVSFSLVQQHVDLAAAYLLMLSASRNLSKQWGKITRRSSFFPLSFCSPPQTSDVPKTQIHTENKHSSSLHLLHISPLQNLYLKSFSTHRPLSNCLSLSLPPFSVPENVRLECPFPVVKLPDPCP